MTDDNPVIYIILNGELNMSAGKAAAQAAHAAMLLEGNYTGLFVSSPKRTIVVLEAESSEEIRNLDEYLSGAEIFAEYYIDECSERGKPYQITALAVAPIQHNDEVTRAIFKDFNLYGANYDAKSTWKVLSDYINRHEGWLGVPWYVRKTVKWFKNK